MSAVDEAWTLAFNRFGLGARPGAVRVGDPRQALLAELDAEPGARLGRPGLKVAELFESRDLRPTTDLRSVLEGALADHLGLSAEVLARAVFPDTLGVAPMKGLIAA